MNIKNWRIPLAILAVILISIYVDNSKESYTVTSSRTDDIYILKNDKVLVAPTIVDMQELTEFIENQRGQSH